MSNKSITIYRFNARYTLIFLLLLTTPFLFAQKTAKLKQTAYQSEYFDLVSINNAFIIHLMEDLSYLQKHVPVQDARLDILHQRTSYFRIGLMSIYLYETASNLSGPAYEPRGFASLAPLGFQFPLQGNAKWQANLFGMLYWANYLDRKSVEKLTLDDYLRNYPKLAEAGVEIDLSALLTFAAGYRQQFWKKDTVGLGSFADINPTTDYSGFYAEVNIGLQSLYRKEKAVLSPITSAQLNLEADDMGVNVLTGNDSLQIKVTLSNTGRFAANEIQLNVTNEQDMPVSVRLSKSYISRLNANEDTELYLTIATDSNTGRSTSGNITLYAIDKKGNTADYLIPLMIEP